MNTLEMRRKSSVDGKFSNMQIEDPAILEFSTRRSKGKNDFEDFPSNFNPKVMENWINETLGDAEHLNIPGILLKPESKIPVSRYRIDRMTLLKGGIPNGSINRIYRSLFVYSVGFYDLIVRWMEHTEQNHSIVAAIWKVFAILIEYCCKSDYTMLISSLANEHKKELEKINADFIEKWEVFSSVEKQLRESIGLLEKEIQSYRKRLEYAEGERERLLEIVTESIETKEKEVRLRVDFEKKINSMHALNRVTEERYQRAIQDLGMDFVFHIF